MSDFNRNTSKNSQGFLYRVLSNNLYYLLIVYGFAALNGYLFGEMSLVLDYSPLIMLGVASVNSISFAIAIKHLRGTK